MWAMPKRASELNALAVSKLATPGLHFVGGVPGLALQVLPSGARTWVLRVMIAGKRRDMGLGGYSPTGMTLARAREAALAAREKIRQGIDPIEANRAARSALQASRAAARTFKQCAEAYMEAHEAGWGNAKHASQWRNTLEKLAYPVMGELLVRDVQLAHVLQVLEPIWRTKTETASRLRSRIELVLDWAAARGFRESQNPARWRGHLDKLLPAPGKIIKRKHYDALPADEMGAFMQRLRQQPGNGARALELAILTAARSGEVRGARWHEFDLSAGVWAVPGERMKAGKEHRVPLSHAALALLKALSRHAKDDLVFPSRTGGLVSDMTLVAVLRRMNVAAVPHGFRSTFRDWAAERTSYPNEVCEMALAHSIGDKVEAAYRRGDLFEKRRRLMRDWASFCATVQPTNDKVVPLKKHRA
jgi:integrase